MKNTCSIVVFLLVLMTGSACRKAGPGSERNLAKVATASFSRSFGRYTEGLNDGLTPADSMTFRRRYMRYQPDQWIQYDWAHPVATSRMEIYFWDYYGVIPLPGTYRILFWDGEAFVPVQNATSRQPENGTYNTIGFDQVETCCLRLEVDSAISFLANVLEWKVFQAGGSADHPPVVDAGGDRDVILGGKTYLSGSVKSVGKINRVVWMGSGPGNVRFEDPKSLETAAEFTGEGEYFLALTVTEGKLSTASSITVSVRQPPPEERLDVVYTKHYKIHNPLWNQRAKAIIANWIPHCIDQINRTDLEMGDGGIDNFIEAAKALREEPHGPHKGRVFSNAWVHQTVESMCIALMVDPQGDPEIIRAQEKMRATLEDWIPRILAAQEPDGYLHTAFTLRDTTTWKKRWEPENRHQHEGYVAGYFLESAINHYTLTGGSDTRLYDGAKKLADCWVENIGPGKMNWYDEHQEMEQALVRFGRFVNDMESGGRGDSYIELAKFLLDNRNSGSEYDQSHVPVQQQYEAVGHAVRASYSYSAMADVAAETADLDYQSAVLSLCNNIVHKKYYVTGGIGSGETSEGFGPNYSLRNNAYCESCSSCGLIFFQYKMNLAYHDAKHADLYEETMYNALLGSLDHEGKNFYYQNPLITDRTRYEWHDCPCCVGNIPRTLLMIPTWTYVKSPEGIYMNLFIGSTIRVDNVAGTDVELVQETDYPWDGHVSLTVNPAEAREFTIFVRIPDRTTSRLYTPDPQVDGILSLSLNGEALEPETDRGYAAIHRRWEAGDRIEFEIPMKVQLITADERIEADRGKVALRYGPLIYNVETVDQDIDKSLGSGDLMAEWDPGLLGGMMVIRGTWSDGSPFMAIPYYARQNRSDPDDAREQVTSLVRINR